MCSRLLHLVRRRNSVNSSSTSHYHQVVVCPEECLTLDSHLILRPLLMDHDTVFSTYAKELIAWLAGRVTERRM